MSGSPGLPAAAEALAADDLAALGSKSAAALERLAKVAQRLNLLTEKALEDARGN